MYVSWKNMEQTTNMVKLMQTTRVLIIKIIVQKVTFVAAAQRYLQFVHPVNSVIYLERLQKKMDAHLHPVHVQKAITAQVQAGKLCYALQESLEISLEKLH